MSSNHHNEAAPSDAELDPAEIRERDEALVKACQSGHLNAYDELVTLYRGKVYAMIVNMIRNEADAWDLAQDVFIKAWKALPKFEARSAFYTWLYRITHNVTYDWMRKKKVRGDSEFDDSLITQAEPGALTAPKETGTPDEVISRGELGDRLETAIESLSTDHRAVILLKEVDGLSYQEIADTLDCSMGTVMSRLFYARKKLQILLQDLNPRP